MFITGCHRSGTSLLSALLKDIIAFGQDSTSGDLEQKLENPLGFFESKRLVEMNDHLLEMVGSSWDNPPLLFPDWSASPLLGELLNARSAMSDYALDTSWVDKDPRLCLTYPAYIHIFLKRVPLAAAIRGPLEVATSLYVRNGFPLSKGLTIWYLYNYHLAMALQDDDLLFCYQELLQLKDSKGNENIPNRLINFLNNHGYPLPSLDQWNLAINRRLRVDLNRSSTSLPRKVAEKVDVKLLNECQEIYENFARNKGSIVVFQDSFRGLPGSVLNAIHFEEKSSRTALINDQSQEEVLRKELEQSKMKLAETEAKLEAIKNSRSWKLSAPLRHWKDRLRLF